MNEGLEPSNETNEVNPQVTDAVTQTDRPEWLPEKFWIDGQPAYDKLAQSYAELEKMRGNMKDSIAQELEEARLAARPESADAYALPEDERLDSELMASSPVVQWWRQFAHEQGYNQEQFETAIKTYAEVQLAQVEEGYQQELKKLGENANVRIEAVQLWANNFFDQGQLDAISAACTTAEGVAAMEKIITALKSTGNADPAMFEKKPEITKADIEKMMQDRRYWHPSDRDPAFVRQVEEFFAKSYR